MASGGHNRKTKQQAERDGTHRPDRHCDPVEVAPGAPDKPPWLSDNAGELWDEIVPLLLIGKVVERIDGMLLATFFEAAALARDAIERMNGSTLQEVTKNDKHGNEWIELVEHPALKPWKDATGIMRSLMGELGMGALARARLGDVLSSPDKSKPELPTGAPPVYTPPAGAAHASSPERCEEHGRKFRKRCERCQQIAAAHPPKRRKKA